MDQDRIDQFAHCTGNQQWIHVDAERARKESPFCAPVAHGCLTLSLLAEMSMDIGVVQMDTKAAFNYGLDKVRFLAPVESGARVRAPISLMELAEQGGGRKLLVMLNNTVEIEGESKPAPIAETLAVLVG